MSYPILDQVAQVMRDYPAIKIRVEGHTDSDGSDDKPKLSRDRANSVPKLPDPQCRCRGSRLRSKGWGENPSQPTPLKMAKRPIGKSVEFHPNQDDQDAIVFIALAWL